MESKYENIKRNFSDLTAVAGGICLGKKALEFIQRHLVTVVCLQLLWGVPKIGVPLIIIHFQLEFSIVYKPSSYWGNYSLFQRATAERSQVLLDVTNDDAWFEAGFFGPWHARLKNHHRFGHSNKASNSGVYEELEPCQS